MRKFAASANKVVASASCRCRCSLQLCRAYLHLLLPHCW